MVADLPNFIDIRRFLEDGEAVSGTIAPQRLTRISAPYAVLSAANFTLRFVSKSDHGLHLNGEVKVQLGAICQRCTDEMSFFLDRDFDVRLRSDVDEYATDAANEDEIETIVISNDKFAITAFAEDEIMLGCPMIPMHSPEECSVEVAKAETVEEPVKKPFADLAALLAQKTNS